MLIQFTQVNEVEKPVCLNKNLATARKIIDLAKQEAEQIVQKQEKQERKLLHEAYKEGYKKGISDSLSNLIAASSLKKSILFSLQQDILYLVQTIVQNVIQTELKIQPQSIITRISNALKQCINLKTIRMLVSPTDYELVSKQFFDVQKIGAEIQVEENSNIKQGSFVIESELGTISSDLNGHFKQIIDALSKQKLVDESLLNQWS